MKHFYLIANPSKPGALDMAEKLETELLRRGASCVHARGYTRADQIPADTECIITLGGDGTLIQASRDLISLDLPMMGINMGHLGYLTQVSREESMEPVLANMILACKVPVNIMYASTRDVGGKAMGQMIIQLPEDEADAARALHYLKTVKIPFEEVRENDL